MELKLEGKTAIAAVILFVTALVGYRIFLHDDLAKNPRVREQLETSLISRIGGAITADSEAIQAALASGDHEEAERLGRGMLERKVVIDDLAMKGSGEDIIVRATYVIHGPEGRGRETGYFRFAHSVVSGWRYRYETTATSWYLKLF